MAEIERLISATESDQQEGQLEEYLRPSRLTQFVGQESVRRQLGIFIQAARARGEALDHVLIFGPPGLGKTTLACIIANELSVELIKTSGPAFERKGDVAATLTRLQKGWVLFVDEIHRLNPVIEEVMYPAMEDFQIDIMLGEGPSAKTICLPIEPFTLVGATTRTGLLTSPLRDRFGIVLHLDYYSVSDMEKIVRRSSRILGTEIDDDGVVLIAERSRGTPRIANRLLSRVRDYAQVEADGLINRETALLALDMLDVDTHGLDVMDRKLLNTLIEKFKGRPVGIETIAAAISEDRMTIEDTIEPYLLQQGFIERTPRGRVATDKAWNHLGISLPEMRRQRSLL